MSKKRKRDLNEKLRAREEKIITKAETDDVLDYKRKTGDDYRDKVVKEENRFQDKIHEKISKRTDITSEIDTSNKSKNAIKRNLQSNSFETDSGMKPIVESPEKNQSIEVNSDAYRVFENTASKETHRNIEVGNTNNGLNIQSVNVNKRKHSKKLVSDFAETEVAKSDYQTEVKENRIYDPLAKDQDDDGVIDRYDNDFRDSDVSYEPLGNKKSKLYEKQKRSLKRKNYSDKLFTRKGIDKKKEDNTKASKTGKEAIKDREKKNQLYKRYNKETIVGGSVIGAAKLGEVTSAYLSSGSDENASVEAAEKGLGSSSKLIHGVKNYSDKRKSKKLYDLEKSDRKIQIRKSKLEFRKSMDEVKKTDQYKKANAYKKFQKKKQMKSAIYKQNKTRIRDRVKKTLMDTFKVSKDFIIRKAKVAAIVVAAIIIFGTFVFNFASMTMGGFANSTSSILTTSYLSRPNVLTEINQSFSNKENDLYSELENIEKNNPGYDEYIINKNGDIGHNVHELLSYITSRCGEVKSLSEVSNILDDLFKTMYHVDYKEEIEIRYKTVTETYTDEEGNEHTESHEEPYEYRKLIVTLNKREMDSVIREVFRDYPDNLKHYEALFFAQGNMGEMFGNTNLITENGGIGGGKEYEASSDVQKKIVNAAYITPSPGAGWCAMWVSQVYQNAGLGYIGGNANDMYRNHTFTSDRSKLKVGMLVAVESSSSGGQAGLTYGHVGIYIGDGKVMDNIGVVRVTTLDDWIATFCKHHPVGFGFPPNVNR
ncbi:NlpC/P60 family protein [Streptococcus pneumoniae]|nr:CHAP domain-containing protein [Streptococcus agalactiae]MDS2496780.1 CHAP domain-containing protein [Streptococcus pneumoniae]AKU03828.1 cell wall hydrolase [Streptococcus agalactiae]KAA9075712.1 CHAP domain-containing protein [Streptococcus agalactiae]KAF1149112.1 CHAP domain-containing protein [Streptococcus agalactiae]MCD0126959.1 CHAP domain-containing protein [Streptococcus agalactiae]